MYSSTNTGHACSKDSCSRARGHLPPNSLVSPRTYLQANLTITQTTSDRTHSNTRRSLASFPIVNHSSAPSKRSGTPAEKSVTTLPGSTSQAQTAHLIMSLKHIQYPSWPSIITCYPFPVLLLVRSTLGTSSFPSSTAHTYA